MKLEVHQAGVKQVHYWFACLCDWNVGENVSNFGTFLVFASDSDMHNSEGDDIGGQGGASKKWRGLWPHGIQQCYIFERWVQNSSIFWIKMI